MPPITSVRDHHGRLRADRERQQLGVAGRAAEHDHDQRLLRPHAAGRDGQERGERPDDHHEQRVAERAGDAERLQEGRGRAHATGPAGQLRHGHGDEVAARRAQDREALAHALCERDAGGLDAPHCQHAGEQEERRDDGRHRRVRDGPRPFEGGDRGQLGHARQHVLREREGEDADAQDDVDERLDEQRCQDRRRGRALQAHAREEDLDQVAAARRRDRVDADSRQVGAGAGAVAVADARVGGAQDRVPGASAQQQVDRVQQQPDRERPELDLRQVVQEHARRVGECGNAAQRAAGYAAPLTAPPLGPRPTETGPYDPERDRAAPALA